MAKRGWVRFKVPISTDPGQIQAAVDSAAVLHGEAEKYGTAEEPITYKVEQTSDGKLYATVYGLQ
jgi:hypothetical protein